MLRKRLLFTTLVLGAGMWLVGCVPAPAPLALPGIGPGTVPDWGWFTGAVCCLTPLVVGVAIILIVAALLFTGKDKRPASRARSGSSSASSVSTVKETIQARYARGEIDRQEYQRLLQDIEGPEQSQSSSKEDVSC